MKRLFIFLLPISLFAQGIQFQDLTWEGALAEARKSNKPVFVDAYATWCQPCKVLEKYTYTNEDVGTLFNTSFVNVKFDMEKYPGLELAETYEVDLYPTLLFINGQGELVHRGCGALEPLELINLAKTALTPDENLGSIRKSYEDGNRSLEVMEKYLLALENACRSVDTVLDDFFLGIPKEDLVKDDNWGVLRDYVFDVYGEEFMFLLKNQEAFEKAQDPLEVQDKIFDTFMLTYSELADSDLALFGIKSLSYLADQHEFDRKEELMDYLRFGMGELIEDWSMYADGAIGFMRPEAEDPELILDISWKFYLFVNNKEQLLAALNWTKSVLDNAEPDPSAIDTYASLLYKLGRKEDAVKFSEQALQLAQSWEMETEHYEYQLAKFKSDN